MIKFKQFYAFSILTALLFFIAVPVIAQQHMGNQQQQLNQNMQSIKKGGYNVA